MLGADEGIMNEATLQPFTPQPRAAALSQASLPSLVPAAHRNSCLFQFLLQLLLLLQGQLCLLQLVQVDAQLFGGCYRRARACCRCGTAAAIAGLHLGPLSCALLHLFRLPLRGLHRPTPCCC